MADVLQGVDDFIGEALRLASAFGALCPLVAAMENGFAFLHECISVMLHNGADEKYR